MRKNISLNKPTSANKPILPPISKDVVIPMSDHLLDLAFNNSMQANIITIVKTGKILMANQAAARLLGYSKKALLTMSRSAIFDINDSSFKKMFKMRSAAGHAVATITAIKKSSQTFPCEISSAIFIGDNGIEKAITTLVDISQKLKEQKKIDDAKEQAVLHDIDLALTKQHDKDCKKELKIASDIKRAKRKSDARLEENNAWIKYIAKTSYDVMWDWDIATNKIYVGDSMSEVFGYTIQNNTIDFADFAGGIVAPEKISVLERLEQALASGKKSWTDTFKVLRKDESIAVTTIRASIVRDDQKKAIRLIGAIQDISRVHKLQEQLEQQLLLQQQEKETFFQTTSVSFDMIWDWNLESDKVFRGEGSEELFGHNFIQENGHISEWKNKIHPDDKDAVEESLTRARQSNDVTWQCSYRFLRANGTVASVLDRANIFRNEEGKAYRMIGALQDISDRKELEEKLEHEMAINENLLEAINRNFKSFALSSESKSGPLTFDDADRPNIISDAGSGKIILANTAACKLLGYTKKELLSKNCSDIFDTTTSRYKKMLTHRSAESYTSALVRATRKNGKTFACEISSAIYLDENAAEKVMNSLMDISQALIKPAKYKQADATGKKAINPDFKSSDALLKEYNETFKLMFNLSSDILCDHDIKAKTVMVNNAYEKELGYSVPNYTITLDELYSHIHPADLKGYKLEYKRMIASQNAEWKHTLRFVKANQEVVSLIFNGIVLRDSKGKAYRVIGYMLDQDRNRVIDEKIKLEIMLREQQIVAATIDAEEQVRSDIGKELHDNVNQLLGASKMYLEMAKRGGPSSEMYLNRSSQYTITAIEEIRRLTKGLASDYIKNLGLIESVENLVNDSMEISKLKISFDANEFHENAVDDKFKLNMFRIVQEQLNNISKHASATEINIVFSQNPSTISLLISDNGVGFDTQKKGKGIGLDNIRSRAITYNGTADFISKPGEGCVLSVKFALAGSSHVL
jgi:PAS domain S-box-containing protein